jgi:hypothetical protein
MLKLQKDLQNPQRTAARGKEGFIFMPELQGAYCIGFEITPIYHDALSFPGSEYGSAVPF